MDIKRGMIVSLDPETESKLATDLSKVWIKPIPLFVQQDDIISTMHYRKTDFFIVPARKSQFKQDVFFRFSKTTLSHKEYGAISGPIMITYFYEGYDFG